MSGNALPYYKRYPRDLIEGTMGMPFEEKAAYAFVLDLIYLQNGKLVDDSRYIAGLLGLSVRKWNSIRDKLIEKGKLVVISGLLTNYRAIIELESLSKYQNKQAENRRGDKENKDLQKPSLNQDPTNQNQNQNQSKKDGGGGSAGVREADPDQGFREQILTACGVDPVSGLTGIGGRQIGTQADMIDARKWLTDLGLTEAEVIAEIIRIMGGKRDGPPSGLRYFTGAMQRLAGAKAAAPLAAVTPFPTKANGEPHGRLSDRARFDVAHREYARRVSAGEIDRGPDPSDPFAT